MPSNESLVEEKEEATTSNNVWDTQADMTHLTGKLTNPS